MLAWKTVIQRIFWCKKKTKKRKWSKWVVTAFWQATLELCLLNSIFVFFLQYSVLTSLFQSQQETTDNTWTSSAASARTWKSGMSYLSHTLFFPLKNKQMLLWLPPSPPPPLSPHDVLQASFELNSKYLRERWQLMFWRKKTKEKE